MGATASCIPNKMADTTIFDLENVRTFKCTNVKQYKRNDEVGKKCAVLTQRRQQTANNQTRFQQSPIIKQQVVVKPEKPQLVIITKPAEDLNCRIQQQIHSTQVPTQVNLNVHFSDVQKYKSSAAGFGRRKSPQPTAMPEPLVQTSDSEESSLVEYHDGASQTKKSEDALIFRTDPDAGNVTTSESTTDSEYKFFVSDKQEELFRCKNPALSTIWGMQFMRECGPLESSDVDWGTDVELESPVQSYHTVDLNGNGRSCGGETSVFEYQQEPSSVLIRDVDANVSDASSVCEVSEENILTDYKCYKYCILDDNGLETKVHVKILKDLSEALLRQAGIVAEDNPLLFGVDPCLKLQRVYDSGKDLYVVSEHDVDMTLKDILSGSGYPELPPLAILYIATELIKKFKKLHEQGIYTNNFGSASVLLAKDGRVCVNDFLESALQKLKHQIVAGPEYRGNLKWNPLSTNGERKKDIYRLGQVIGKLVVGNKFQYWLRSGEDIEMMLLAENVPKPILQIICRCLRSRDEMVCMDEINSIASFYFRFNDLSSGRLELQQYLNFNA